MNRHLSLGRAARTAALSATALLSAMLLAARSAAWSGPPDRSAVDAGRSVASVEFVGQVVVPTPL